MVVPEFIDHRYPGAVAFTDGATGALIQDTFELTSPTAVFFRNRKGFYVVVSAVGFEAYTAAFDEVPEPPVPATSFTVQVKDPVNRYLSRTFVLDLPRDPDPEHAEQTDSLFQPRPVLMFRSPAAATGMNWSVVRISASFSPAGGMPAIPAAGALIRAVDQASDEIMAFGLTDKRGEALVAVPAVPATTFSTGEEDDEEDMDDDPVLTLEIPFHIQAAYDPAAEWPVNPDQIEENWDDLENLEQDINLIAGKTSILSMAFQA